MAPMLRKFGMLFVAVTLAFLAATAAFAGVSTMTLSASMNPRQVVPDQPRGKVAHATGLFVGTLSQSGPRWKLAWRISYRKLDHPVIVIADIHRGKPGKFGPILARLCGPCRSGAHGVKVVKASDVPVIKSGRAFITLITARNPNGEVRGQIVVR
jgi:CHRD domain